MTGPKGLASVMVNTLTSTASMLPIAAPSSLPETSRLAQRLIEAMQSVEVTGVPSLHLRPGRSVKVHTFLSAETL